MLPARMATEGLTLILGVPRPPPRPRRAGHFPVANVCRITTGFRDNFRDGSMLLGYARVSTDDQDLALQRRALREAGCRRLYEEKLSGVQRNRPELARLLDQVRDDDVLVVTRLDRLARSTRDLLDVAEQLRDAGAGLRSLAEPWADTTGPAGRMVLTVFAGIAEFERALILGRTSAGRVAAQQKGVRFGRPPALAPDQVALGRKLVDEGKPVREVVQHVQGRGVHRAQLHPVAYLARPGRNQCRSKWLPLGHPAALSGPVADPVRTPCGRAIQFWHIGLCVSGGGVT